LNEPRSRYRVEGGIPCIDVSTKSIEHLFDNRDPAPFRDRDFDPSLVEYLIGAAEELAASKNLCVVFWLAEPCLPGEIEAAHRAHFGTMLYDWIPLRRERKVITKLLAAKVDMRSGTRPQE
jgi:hypothetical protein